MEPIERDWLNKMTEARNITIDGRPLYAYRITSAEYQSLRDILAARCQEPLTLDDLLEERGFSILFVFFATEWYKREYVGGVWRWDDIFAKFTTKTVKKVDRRSEAVQSALRGLKREIPEGVAGKKYFGAIITNGGLPAKYIQNNRSPLGIVGLITAALKYKLKYVVSMDELSEYVEDRAASYNFPDSLQNESMYQLIVDVVEKVVDLKNRYNLNSKSGAITKLDTVNPEWRKEFPILLEDDAIRTLLNTLMQDASEVKVAQKRPFVRRFLNGNPDELFLDLEVVFPAKPVEKDYFVRYFGMNDDLPQTFYLNTWDGNKTKVAKIEADLFKPDVYTIVSYCNKLPVTESVILETYSPINDKDVNGAKVRLAENIDLAEPLVFITDEKGKYVYVGSGDVGVATSVCWIGLPVDSPIAPSELECVNTFKVGNQMFNLYKCDKANAVIGNYEIRLNDTTKPKQYVLGGRLLPFRTKPYDTYVDLPQLYYIDEDQNYIKEQNVVFRRHHTDTAIPNSECFGLVDVCCIKNGRTICKLPAFVLPVDSTFEYKNETATGGDIAVRNFSPLDIMPINNPGYSASVTNYTVTFESLSEIPPATVGLGVVFPNDMGQMDVELPFPAKGFGFYDENQSGINNTTISLNNLHGKRINIFGLRHKCFMTFDSETQRIERDLPTKNSFAEYRLIDYENDIRFLFSNSAEDVVLNISEGFARPAKLFVSKYDMTAEVREGSVFVVAKTAVDLSKVALSAIDLLSKDAKPVSVPITADGIIDTSALGPGVYVIYTPAGSDYSLMPLVYRNLSNPEINDFYRYIVWGDNKELRHVLRTELANGFDSEIWQDIDRLSQLFISNGIPLDSINLWSCIANVPHVLAMYLFRGVFVKPYLDKSQKLPDAIQMASSLIDTQYACTAQMLYKMRNELLVNCALLPTDVLADVVSQYKVYFNRVLDEMFMDHIHSGCDQQLWDYMADKFKEPFADLKNQIWDKQYSVIASVFKEISFVLCTKMYADMVSNPMEFLKKVQSLDDSHSLLRTNMIDWSSPKKAEEWSDELFGELNQMLNAYMSPVTDGYSGIQIPVSVSNALTDKCECKDTCKAPLFNFQRYPEIRSFVIHFPMFCAWLAHQGQDDYLVNPELIQTVKNFIRFHVNYFLEAYRISTIILSKV